MPRVWSSRQRRIALTLLGVVLGGLWSVAAAFGQDFQATIPKVALDTLVTSAVIEIQAEGGPAGPLHQAGPTSSNDCEFHFVITPADGKWRTAPTAWVAEPPNVCLYDQDGNPPDIDDLRERFKVLKPKWKNYAAMLKGKDVVVEGVPRVWFEHMGEDGPPSSPGHAFEIHPATKITVGGTAMSFANFIHDIPNNPGISENTVFNTLKRSKVTIENVTAQAVHVGFEKHSNLGNFARLQIRIDLASLTAVAGGHRARATVRANGEVFRVAALSIGGTKADERIRRAKESGQKTTTLRVLALFSLDPSAIRVYPRVLPFSVLLALRFSRVRSPRPPRELGGGEGRREVSVAAGSGSPQ